MDRRKLRVAAGVLISLIFLYLSVRGIDWAAFVRLFRGASYGWLVLAAAMITGLSWLRGLRWHYLVRKDAGITVRALFHLMNIGYFFSNTLPAKAGEFIRGYLAGRHMQGGYGRAASSVLIGALLDALSMIVMLAALLPILDMPEWIQRGGMVFGAAAIAGTVVLLIIAWRGQQALERLWATVERLPVVGTPGVKRAFTQLIDGFGVLLERRYLVPILLTTVAIWAISAVLNYVMMLVFGMGNLPFTAAVMVLCATGFSMMVPSSPGAVGVFEWAGVQGLLLFAVEQSAAFGYMLGLHLFTNLTLIVLGIIGMVNQGVTYAQVRRVVDTEQHQAGTTH
ncbi:MAG: lysylphosphatidylglycerol synthase transmembrane domain-containing protein [Anaerolineae bacterium]|jgi:uncharacterized protein (TIRG00374 family)